MDCFVKILLTAGLLCCVQIAGVRGNEGSPETSADGIRKTGFIEVADGRLFYEDRGSGDAVVFVHDGLVHSESWEFQYDAFSTFYRVIRYDRRGYGESPPPAKPYSDIDDLNTIITALNIQSATLIGCSAGSGICLDFAEQHPEKVREMVLIGAVVGGYPMTRHFATRGGRISPADYTDLDKVRKFFSLDDPYGVGPGHSELRQKIYQWLMKYPGNLDFKRSRLRRIPDVPAVKRLSEITCPVLVLTGEYDIPDVHAHSGAISAGIPGATREVVSGSGHLAHLDNPDTVNPLILGFCAANRFQRITTENGLAAAIADARRYPEGFRIPESILNSLGYDYLLIKKEPGNAVAVFELNVEMYPDSSNVYDSLGEALLASGDTVRAVENYRKSLALNPDNSNAAAVLKKIGGE